MLVKAFELSCVRRQSLKIARPLENQSSNMKTLKPVADPNLKHDAIAAMRHPAHTSELRSIKPPKNPNRHTNMPAISDVAYLYFKIVAFHTLAFS